MLRDLYRSSEAVLMPGEEDFGIVPLEAQACGTPVVALGLGGATETVRDGETGVLYAEPGADGPRSPRSTACAASRSTPPRCPATPPASRGTSFGPASGAALETARAGRADPPGR